MTPFSRKDIIMVKTEGRELLKRKLTGYVSYVRGENPLHFHIEYIQIHSSHQEHSL